MTPINALRTLTKFNVRNSHKTEDYTLGNPKQNKTETDSTARELTTCAVCLSDVEPLEGITLNCKHAFHNQCIFTSLTTSPNNMRCPTCRDGIFINEQSNKTQAQFYEFLIQKEPNNPKWHNNLALAELKDKGKSDHVFKHLLKAIKLDSKNAAIWLNIASNWPEDKNNKQKITLVENGRTKTLNMNRLQAYQKVLEIQPNNRAAYLWQQTLKNNPKL